MNNNRTLKISVNGKVATVWLDRPVVKNAFNLEMLEELTKTFVQLSDDESIRVVVLRGENGVFCSGADLNWMKSSLSLNREENYREALVMAECFYTIFKCSKPVISVIRGASTGGANGLIAASDFSICSDTSLFSLAEVRLGLVPAVIAPYIIRRLGEFKARELMLTGKKIDGIEAARINLVNNSYPEKDLEKELELLINNLMSCGPNALKITKELIFEITSGLTPDNILNYCSGVIAEVRQSDEGQEGVGAFLEKRDPVWKNREIEDTDS